MKAETTIIENAELYDVKKIREDFPILKRKVNGKPLVYLDNAATSQKPQQVIDALTEYYSMHNANIHRGVHRLSEEATQLFEDSHKTVSDFINADFVAQGLSPFSPEKEAMQAGRTVIKRVREYASQSKDFGFETTLSGKTNARLFAKLRANGYRIFLFF